MYSADLDPTSDRRQRGTAAASVGNAAAPDRLRCGDTSTGRLTCMHRRHRADPC